MSSVHQILFGWAERDSEGNAGVRPLADSGAPSLDRWTGRLPNIWAAKEAADDPGEARAGLVHLVFEDEAAVLRKLPARNAYGRAGATVTHALVGDPGLIDAALALGLHDWSGWLEREPHKPDTRLLPLDIEELRAHAAQGLAALRDRVPNLPKDQLTAAVAQVLGAPDADFTFITRPEYALPLMTAVHDIVGPVPGRPWTFAGRESTDVGGHQPRVVFLSARPPQSYYVNQRRRVETAGAPLDPDGTGFAAQLVELYLDVGYAAVHRVRPGAGVATADDVAAWRRSVPVVDGRIVDDRLPLDLLLDDDLLYRASMRGAVATEGRRLAGELRKQPAHLLIEVMRRWGPNESRSVRHPELRETAVREAVVVCLTQSCPEDLIEGTAQARPRPGLVADVFREREPHQGLDLSEPRQAYMVCTALTLGMEVSHLNREGLFAPSSESDLLEFVRWSARPAPDAAVLVLRRHLGAGTDREARERAARAWSERDLLRAEVEAAARGDKATEVDCYSGLLTAAYGPRLSASDARAVVERAGDDAPLGLLTAALWRAGEEAAETHIRYALSELLLRGDGYAHTAPSGRRATRVEGAPPQPVAPLRARPSVQARPPQTWPAEILPPETWWPHDRADERGHAPERIPERFPERQPAERSWVGGLDPVNTAFMIAILAIIVAAVGYIVWTSL
ncbi:hypothetical protein [Streptomyces endophyticus]|uniref:Uncharacterized protein n=1 Tax=Streptomyces endophyticus TaxID=714166 RepID=A0ABU6FG27_9ACTN|nr:hypothetical protein [Streptomyces endophyticus]MEB8342998.1 hypothetical protein [Streptomyces endophyticus]